MAANKFYSHTVTFKKAYISGFFAGAETEEVLPVASEESGQRWIDGVSENIARGALNWKFNGRPVIATNPNYIDKETV